MIRTQAGTYEVIEENRDGWNPEAFRERYSDILDKYDYIVGDWGYGQLRLRGFYSDANRKVPFEQRISALDEYLQEFCNFGCPYFVLQKVKSAPGAADDQTQLGAGEDAAESRPVQGREDGANAERKERRRYYSRSNKQERAERYSGGSAEYRSASGRSERADKPRYAKDKPDKNGREGGTKEKRPNQPRTNRERDKVSSGPNQPKRDS